MEYKSARKILSENLEQLMKQNNITQIELSKVPKSRITERQDVIKKEQDTIAAHFDKEDLTEDEKQEVEDFINYLKSKRK